MDLNPLNAVSPVDGRYRSQSEEYSAFFSESALMKYRLTVEVEYFIALSELPLPQLVSVNKSVFSAMRDICKNFSEVDAKDIKAREKVTNHDVKALEYFLKDKLRALGVKNEVEFIHFGLTSQDVNNTAFPMAIRDAVVQIYLPQVKTVVERLSELSNAWTDIPMLSRTHGQPASPTRLGKEIRVFVERLSNQLSLLSVIPFTAKFGGATGNFNAHHVAYPEVNWIDFANRFVEEKLKLKRQQFTTQIEHYDNLCALFDAIKRINNILIDLNRDIWTYISMDYFKQEIKAGEVGSSAMPHKVNPIDFENSEGNLGIANSFLEHLSEKLPISRLQRDLTDSTVLRNTGVPFAHTSIALKSLLKGLNKLIVNESALKEDLENNWAVVAEGIQTILRRENYPNPYEKLKELTRTHIKIDQASMHAFIDTLDVSSAVKSELKRLTPFNYTGI
ncbi:MAG: adenylosuccinate lyase [Bacteroidia bacterium]